MWLLTPVGFFSAVQDGKDAKVMQVRTRSKDDALVLARWLLSENLVTLDKKHYPTVESLVLEWRGRDYPYRVLVWREDWAAFCYYQALGIDYRNFKDEVKKRQGQRRASIYGRIWGVLLDVSREHLPLAPARTTTIYPPAFSGRLWDELQGTLADTLSPGDTDERCPRCDKFLSEMGLSDDGDCKKCVAELDAAIEAEDWDQVQAISQELGLIADQS